MDRVERSSPASGSRPGTGSRFGRRTPARRRTRGEMRGGGDGARARRGRCGVRRAAASPSPRGDPRRSGDLAGSASRGGGRNHLRRGRQAAEDGARRGRTGRLDLPLRRRRGSPARGRDGADGRFGSGSRKARVHDPGRSASSRRSARSTSRSTSSRTRSRPRSPPAAPSCSSRRRRRRSRRSSSPSSSRRPGLPAGWLNVVAGPSSEIGDVLVGDDRVKLITFTGSAEVGWGIAARAARKRVKLELGNATPLIVDEGADLETAAAAIAANAFSFAGQSCISIQRVYALSGIYDELVAARGRARRGAQGRRSGRSRDRRRPADQRGRPRPRARLDRRVGRRGADGRNADRGRAAAADGDRKAGARRQGGDRRGLRPGLHDLSRRVARRGDRAGERHPLRAAGGDLHPEPRERAPGRRASSSSAASSSTRPRPSGPTRCPTAGSRTRATRRKARPGRCAR